jgi:hypothetical protein
MTTKAPSPVRPAAAGTLESLAYASVAGIPTHDPHDRDRLGFTLWHWLQYRRDPLDVAIRNAGARLLISEEEALGIIRARLRESGIALE